MTTETEKRKEATQAKAAAFIAAVQAVMKAHEVTEFAVHMESGRGWEGYTGAHIEIEFASHSTEAGYEYFDTTEISGIEVK
jgi:hypothetical protein